MSWRAVPREWDFSGGSGVDLWSLPPDLTPGDLMCPSRYAGSSDDAPPWSCTRRPGHTGRHAAGAIGRIVAVWADPPQHADGAR